MSSFIPKINLGINKSRSKSNLSFDSQTTANIGFVQPTLCRMLVPNSSAKIKSRTLVRMSPLVNPTFGRLSQRDYYTFVRMSDLYKPWAEFLSGKPYSNYEESYIPTSLPRFNLNHVVAAIIANFSYIGISVGSNPHIDIKKNSEITYAALFQLLDSLINDIQNYNLLTGVNLSLIKIKDAQLSEVDDPYSNCSVITNVGDYLSELFTSNGDVVTKPTTIELPTYTDSDFSFFVPGQSLSSGLTYVDNIDGQSKSFDLSQEGIYLHFRLKPYAKNLRKILVGLGYSFNPFDTELYTPFKILAFYKSWFETFVPNRDVQFTDTQVYRVIKSFDSVAPTEIITSQMVTLFLGNFRNAFSYYTSPDYFSASIANLGDNSLDSQTTNIISSPVEGNINSYLTDEIKTTYQVNSIDDLMSKFGSVGAIRILGLSDTGDLRTVAGGSIASPTLGSNIAVNSKLHALSLNMMLRLLRFTNKNNVIGRSIRDYAKAHYGIDDLQTDSNMSVKINSSRVDINFDDVMNTAASPDAFLGEYAGKGIGYKESDTTYFTAEDFGFIICMSVIVPESGYFQGSLKENKIYDKFEFFTEEFDAIGYDVITRGEIKNDFDVKSEDFDPAIQFDSSKGFGFIPRYSHFKVGRNIVNGDLTLRSTREGLKGYYLDKIFPSIKERDVYDDSFASVPSAVVLEEPDYLPSVVSTNIRKIDLQDNVGNYNRIFQYTDVDLDHFIIQKVFDFEVVAPWKSLADSFDTFGSEDNGTITRNHQ